MDRQKVTVDDATEAVKEHADPVVATSSIADALDVSDPTARKWLKRARDAGRIGQKQLPSGVRVWFPPSAGQSMLGQFADDVPDPEPEEEPEVSTDGGETATKANVREIEEELSDFRTNVLTDLAGLEQRIKDLGPDNDNSDDDTADGGPYADVRSPSRRAALKERDSAKKARNLIALLTAGALGAVLAIDSFGRGLAPLGVDIAQIAAVLAVFFAVAFLATLAAWAVVEGLLRLGAFEWVDRALPFRPEPDGDT
jgi:transposase-like protein